MCTAFKVCQTSAKLQVGIALSKGYSFIRFRLNREKKGESVPESQEFESDYKTVGSWDQVIWPSIMSATCTLPLKHLLCLTRGISQSPSRVAAEPIKRAQKVQVA